jgi:hypothetical protein
MSEVKVTRLPPGKAIGCDDLQRWGKQRLLGRSGVPKSKAERKLAEREDPTAYWLAQAERKARSK